MRRDWIWWAVMVLLVLTGVVCLADTICRVSTGRSCAWLPLPDPLTVHDEER